MNSLYEKDEIQVPDIERCARGYNRRYQLRGEEVGGRLASIFRMARREGDGSKEAEGME
jgi:hypothetical protein